MAQQPEEKNKILINRDDFTLKGYNYLRKKIYYEHKDESIYLKILKYADIVLKYCIRAVKLPLYKPDQKRLTIQQELVDIYEGKDYITAKNKFYGFIKRYRNYEAIVYLIKCKKSFPDNWFK